MNCDAWTPQQVGTLDHLDHLILANFGTWSKSTDSMAQLAGRLFSRTPMGGHYLKLPPFKAEDANYYFEANILMNPRLPEGVSLIIGDFGALFATDEGIALQALAQQRGWPLAWSRGFLKAGFFSKGDIPGNGRVLDPMVGKNQSFNATFPTHAEQSFADLWSNVTASRSQRQPTQDQLEKWWGTFASTQLQVAPVSAYSCADPDSCVVVDANTNQCICKSGSSSIIV